MCQEEFGGEGEFGEEMLESKEVIKEAIKKIVKKEIRRMLK